MANGYCQAKALQVAAELGVADLIAETPKTADQLAKTVGANSDALYRLLRALASLGIFKEDHDGRFENTPLSEPLRTGVPGSARDYVINFSHDVFFLAWAKFMDVIKTGKPSFKEVNGYDQWEYFHRHPEVGERFNKQMSARTAQVASALLEAYDFSQFKTLIDIGGGLGTVLAAIVEKYPHLHGCLYDQASVIEGAKSFLDAKGVLSRCDLVSGDFLQSVPKGFDAYLMKSILHDWQDGQALEILKQCRAAMDKNGTLLIIDAVISRDNAPHPGKWKDLFMLVCYGSRERTEEEFRNLLRQAGFELKRVIALPLPDALIEAVPV
ncbi:MAG TPA: methyltransferase [Candidatus Binatia bacterium]|nr:methyltransferase [Candidatus Binatia bacterium]